MNKAEASEFVNGGEFKKAYKEYEGELEGLAAFMTGITVNRQEFLKRREEAAKHLVTTMITRTSEVKKEKEDKTNPKERYKQALVSFIEELEAIDCATPYSIVEPEWWLDMSDLERIVRERLMKRKW